MMHKSPTKMGHAQAHVEPEVEEDPRDFTKLLEDEHEEAE